MDGRPDDIGTTQRPHGEAGSSTALPSDEHDTLRDVLLRGSFVYGASIVGGGLRRFLSAVRADAPRLHEVCEDAASDIAAWTRQGGALRALLVVSFGSASLAALTVLLVVVFFAAAATTNAIVCSLAVLLVAAGGFLAVLLAVLVSMYVGALSVAVFIVATTTAATVIVITIATGCAAFLWMVWFVAAKCMDLLVTTTKRSMSTANSLM